MGEWFAENWYICILLIIYLVERSPEVLKSLKDAAQKKVEERAVQKVFGDKATEDDKQKRSKGKRVLSGVLHLLPFISRIKRMVGK